MPNGCLARRCRTGSLLACVFLWGAWLPMAGAQKGPRSALCQAITSGKLAQVQAAIQGGDDVNEVFEKDTMLCRAITSNNVEIAMQILQSPKVDVNKRGTFVDGFNDEWERTPLIIACKRGYTEIVHQLLKKGADLNARDRANGSPLERGSTALMMAAGFDHMDTVRALFAHAKKPDVQLRNKDGKSAFWMACANENLEMVQFLFSQGSKVDVPDKEGKSVLTTTLLHKQFDVLDFLVAKGADINRVDEAGFTPLMTAVISNHSQKPIVLKYLDKFFTFKPKLDLQQIKPRAGGESALHLAAHAGFVEGIQVLLDHGANLDLTSLTMGRTALATAVVAKQLEAVRYLIKRGAKTELADKSAFTPLTLAVIKAEPDMVRVLVEGRALTEFRAPGHNYTPLVAAAANLDPFNHGKCLTIIKILLDARADINFQASDGRTALLAAAASSNQGQGLATATLLLDRGANPDVPNTKGETPLMLAAGNGNEKVVKLLLKKEAKIDLKTGAGETVMSFAQRSGNTAIVSLLTAKGAEPDAPITLTKVVVKELVGAWVGQQDGLPQAVFNLVLNKDNSFTFVSRYSPAALKQLPKGSVNPVIASQKGTYTVNNNFLVLNIPGAAPLSRKWTLENGVFILDNIIRLKKQK